MKTDRFMRVMLVLIALLLGANCLKDVRNPLTDDAVEAASPAVIQVGKRYILGGPAGGLGGVTIKEIDRNGWIKGDDGIWYNTAQLVYVKPD
jgi:hypothetical protein